MKGWIMDSIGLISKNKEKVKKFFLGHDSTDRPNAFTDLQDDATHADRTMSKQVWSATFMDKTKDQLLKEIEKLVRH